LTGVPAFPEQCSLTLDRQSYEPLCATLIITAIWVLCTYTGNYWNTQEI